MPEEKKKSKRSFGYLQIGIAVLHVAVSIGMLSQTWGSRLLYIDATLGRICRFYWIPFLIAMILLIWGMHTLKKNPKLEVVQKPETITDEVITETVELQQKEAEKNITEIAGANITEEKQMAFLENFGKKLTQAGQATIQKTKEMADIARVNSLISDEESRINDLYLKIGKMYVELHETDAETVFQKPIEEINDAKRKIIEYQAQLLEIKGVARCTKCGAEVPTGSVFCATCGAPIQTMEKAADTGAEDVSIEEAAVENPVVENQAAENE